MDDVDSRDKCRGLGALALFGDGIISVVDPDRSSDLRESVLIFEEVHLQS